MHSFHFSMLIFPVKAFRTKIAAAFIWRKQITFTHRNSTLLGTQIIIVFHFSNIRTVHMRRKFNNPWLPIHFHHNFRFGSATGSAQTIQFIQFFCLLCIQNALTLFCQFIQIIHILTIGQISFGTINKCSHPLISHYCQTVNNWKFISIYPMLF